MPHHKHEALALDIGKLAPDVWELVKDIVAALNKKGPGGATITAEEWLELGQDVGVIGLDLLPSLNHPGHMD